MRWNKRAIDPAAVSDLARRYEIDLLTAAVLERRGRTAPDEIRFYLDSDLGMLHDPFLFPDMPDVVERILQAREEGERVFVFGDRDVDGITSTAIMVRTLRELGLDVLWEVPEGDAAYGLSHAAVERARAADVTLIITVDCGITNVDEITAARDAGIDTIVVDHHNPQEALPPAVAMINPKLGDDYPFDGLCACAVAAKVRQALAVGSTELFGEMVTLLNARPANDAIVVDAVMMEHGVEVDRVSEALVPGIANLEMSRLGPFLFGRKLVCYDEPLQQRLLVEGLGGGADIYMIDMATEVAEHFPRLAGRSLLDLREGSRLARYGEPSEMDTMVALYRAIIDRRFPSIREALVSVLDFVAIATLSDMMPIVNENRVIVRAGLERVSRAPNTGLAELLGQLELDGRTVASRDVNWQISPTINASGRMGTPQTAVQLFVSDDAMERRVLAAQLKELNRERKKIGDSAWKRVLPRAEQERDAFGGKFVVVHEPEVHRGVTGIIAGKLARRFNLPAAVVTTVDDVAVGSVRSSRGFMATQFLQQFDDIFEKWGGHNEAAGFQFPVGRIDRFFARLTDLGPAIALDEDREDVVEIDAEIPPAHLQPSLEGLVKRFEPYGQGSPHLRFLARNLVLEDAQHIGRDQAHLKLTLAGGGYRWPAMWWNSADHVPEGFRQPTPRVDVVFELERSYYNGSDTLRMVVIDLRMSAEQIVDAVAERAGE